MESKSIKSHLTTTNIYVQQTIVRNNISILNNNLYLSDKSQLNWLEKKELQKQLDAQIVLLHKIKKLIKIKEQFSLPFLPFSGTNP